MSKQKWYVIKNIRKGAYYDGSTDNDCWVYDINFAYFYSYKGDAEHDIDASWNNCKFDDDCEVFELCEDDEEYQDLKEEIRVLKKALLDICHSFGCVSEVCVDESKWHISSENAVDKIRSYLREMDFAFDDIEDKLGVDYFIKARKQQAKESKDDDKN